MEYEVWILGYNEDDTVNDYEKLIAIFENFKEAEWFVENYPFQKPTETPKSNIVIERVEDCSCQDILYEREL